MNKSTPRVFERLLSDMCIAFSDILKTSDGFFLVNKSVADILSSKGVLDFPDASGERLACSKFFDDWFLYAVSNDTDYTYSLLKLREQEHDTEDGSPADGDTPGVTISFVSFDAERLLDCLADPADENRRKLNTEINRVAAQKRQRHHKALKRYFTNAGSEGAYLVAGVYVIYVASFSQSGYLEAPEHYKEIVQRSISYKNSESLARLPRFIEKLNWEAGYTVCDNNRIFIKNREELTEYESAAILATHTGNTSPYSFAAEVEYHARFLSPLFRITMPFFGRSISDSAVRADMSVGDAELLGMLPFYRENSRVVKRQYKMHSNKAYNRFSGQEHT